MRIPNIPGFDQQAFEKYFKNTGMMLFGKVGSLLIKMLVNIKIANYLGRYDNGVLTGCLTYVFFFSSIASLGVDLYVVKELHSEPQKRDTILGTAFWLKVMAGIICLPIIVIAFYIYPLKDLTYHYIFVLSFIGVVQAFNVIDSYFQSEIKSKYIMQVQIIGIVISSVIKFILIYLHQPIQWFVYAGLLDVILLSAGYFIAYQSRKLSVFNWSFNYELGKKLLSYSWPLIISGIMVSVYMKIDQIMLLQMMGAKEQGAYATVVSLSEAWYFFPSVIVASLFPAILNAKRDDPARYKKRVQHLYDLMTYISVSLALIITFTSHIIYQLYKTEYAYAAPVLSVHIWAGVFVFLGVASTQYLIAEGYNKLTFIRTGFGAIVNIVLNLLLIPKMGMMGAAVATLAAYASSTLFIIFIPKVSNQAIMMLKSLFLISLFQKTTKS
jgi:O-antigen/teichoic acid export membrane protein